MIQLMNTAEVQIRLFCACLIVGGTGCLQRGGVSVPDTVPDFNASRFTNPTTIDNPFFPLTPGTVLTYQGETTDGTERIVIEVLNETREVMGVISRVVRDRAFIDDIIVEDTFDWYAQDDAGNVQLFVEGPR